MSTRKHRDGNSEGEKNNRSIFYTVELEGHMSSQGHEKWETGANNRRRNGDMSSQWNEKMEDIS
jgi:hypothetical protein